MRYEITLKNRKKLVLPENEYKAIEGDLLSGTESLVKTRLGVFNVSDVVTAFPMKNELNIGGAVSNRGEMKKDFLRSEEEYKKQSPKEKAKRDYYTRFMGMVLAVCGLPKVFGEDYSSPALTEEYWKTGSWRFTGEQRAERRKRFDRWVAKSDYATLWGRDMKNFFVEYFEKNPNKSWVDLDEWWPIFIEGKLPTTRFDKMLIQHESQVN